MKRRGNWAIETQASTGPACARSISSAHAICNGEETGTRLRRGSHFRVGQHAPVAGPGPAVSAPGGRCLPMPPKSRGGLGTPMAAFHAGRVGRLGRAASPLTWGRVAVEFAVRRSGGIGRHAAFRAQCALRACGFKSHLRHTGPRRAPSLSGISRGTSAGHGPSRAACPTYAFWVRWRGHGKRTFFQALPEEHHHPGADRGREF